MDCFGAYFTHVQSCDVPRVQSATEWTASVHTSHMSKAIHDVTLVQNSSQWAASVQTSHMSDAALDCFGTDFTQVQSCDATRVQSATEWTASVHTSHMSKFVM